MSIDTAAVAETTGDQFAQLFGARRGTGDASVAAGALEDRCPDVLDALSRQAIDTLRQPLTDAALHACLDQALADWRARRRAQRDGAGEDALLPDLERALRDTISLLALPSRVQVDLALAALAMNPLKDGEYRKLEGFAHRWAPDLGALVGARDASTHANSYLRKHLADILAARVRTWRASFPSGRLPEAWLRRLDADGAQRLRHACGGRMALLGRLGALDDDAWAGIFEQALEKTALATGASVAAAGVCDRLLVALAQTLRTVRS